MLRDLADRAKALNDSVPSRPPLPPKPKLVEVFCEVHVERSPSCLRPAVRNALYAMLGVAVLGAVIAGVDSMGWIPHNPVRRVGDIRLLSDYYSHSATSLAIPGTRDLLITTLGGALQRLRFDAGLTGVWQTIDSERTHGLLPDPNLVQAAVVGTRVYFVGAGGSLSSCTRDFRDWRLHFGGTGFAANLDAAAELTVLVPSSDESFFAMGTRTRGAALYDVRTRQWQPLIPDAAVNAILVRDGRIWIAASTGLYVFLCRREYGVLRVSPAPHWELPKDFHNLPVHDVRFVTAATGDSVDIVAGRGAHLSSRLDRPAWHTVVGLGDDKLADCSVTEFSGLVRQNQFSYLLLPGCGVARYDSVNRHLELDGAYRTAAALLTPDGGNTIYVLSEGRLSLRGKDKWEDVKDRDVVAQASFMGTVPVLLHSDGSLSVGGASLFPAADASRLGGAADIAGGRVVTSRGNLLQYYLAGQRGWIPLPAVGPVTNPPAAANPASPARLAAPRRKAARGSSATIAAAPQPSPTANPSILQISAEAARIGVVIDNGEAGQFAGDAYQPLFGHSDMRADPTPVTSAAVFQKLPYFLRDRGVFAYDASLAALPAAGEPLPAGFIPRKLLPTSAHLHVLGQGNWPAVLRLRDGKWHNLGNVNAAEAVAGADEVAVRSSEKSVSFFSDSGRADYFNGSGSARWRKLATDRYGRLWGVTLDGRLLDYTAATATWRDHGAYYYDLAIQQELLGDVVYAATTTGVRAIAATDTLDARAPLLAGHTIVQLDFRDDQLWALESKPDSTWRKLWRPLKFDSNVVWESDGEAPGEAEWRQAAWSHIQRDSLWVASASGELWRYSLDRPRWQKASRTTPGFHNARLADGAIWWQDGSGSLNFAVYPEMTVHTAGETHVDLSSRRHTLDTMGTVVLALAGVCGLVVLAIVVVVIVSAWRAPHRVEARRHALEAKIEQEWTDHPVMMREDPEWARTHPPRRRLSTSLVYPEQPSAGPWCAGLGIALALTAAAFGVERGYVALFLDPLTPFESFERAGPVRNYWVESSHVTIETPQGLWEFDRSGGELKPDSFHAGATRTPAPPRDTPHFDDSGAWSLQPDGGGYRLSHRDDAGWSEARFGDHGLLRDQFESVAMVDGGWVAATPEGLAEFELDGVRSHFYPVAGLSSNAGTMLNIGGAVWHSGAAGARRYLGRKGNRWSVQPLRPAEMRMQLVLVEKQEMLTFERGPAGDSLDRSLFDPAAGRFLDDIPAGLGADDKGKLWVKTRGKWRGIEGSGKSAHLTKTDKAPPVVSRDQSIAINARWTVHRQEGDLDDSVSFAFTPANATTHDPFRGRGRFPDEDARTVGALGEDVWIGTPWGIRQAGSDAIQLPGKSILNIERFQDRLYARGEDATYVLDHGKWRAAVAPSQIFQNSRRLTLALGPGLAVSLTETLQGGRRSSALDAFDASGGRFLIDQIQGVEGDPKGLRAISPAGLQRLEISAGAISASAIELPGHRPVALRADAAGRLCATAANGPGWRLDGQWRPISSGDPDSPFGVRTGPLTATVSWERRFNVKGDTWRFYSAAGDVPVVVGKLASDYVTALTETGAGPEITRAGIAGKDRLVPMPPASPARIGVEGSTLVARVPTDTLAFVPGSNSWATHATKALDAPQIGFDGLRWSFSTAGDLYPALLWNDLARRRPVALNGRGQFPFDDAHSIATHLREVWVATQDRVTVFQSADFHPERAMEIPASALTDARVTLIGDDLARVWIAAGAVSVDGAGFRPPEAEELQRLRELMLPEWQGEIHGRGLRLHADSRDLAVEWQDEFAASLPLPAEMIGLAVVSGDIWAASRHGVYRIPADRLPHGKPRPAPPKTSRDLLASVYFDPGSWKLSTKADADLALVAEKVRASAPPVTVLWIEGRTDHVGSLTANQILSQNRAAAVTSALVNLGIRVEFRNVGLADTSATATSKPGQAADRRVDIRLRPSGNYQ